jgi:acetylornithine deacetylase/succinyl-diaminopimelate desuccinylase-like protein
MLPNPTVTVTRIVAELMASPRVQAAFQFLEDNADSITNEQIAISSIPAPPFGEGKRAEYFCSKFRELGLEDPDLDSEGNCIALRRGRSLDPLVVVSAHLDTVFPAGTDVTVRRREGRLFAPGIADDGCGLVALLALARSLQASEIKTEGSILLVATVGEEGEGNLRGVRHLLSSGPWANRCNGFISFDGPGVDRIINRALGSKRYRVKLRGPGGHSWSDFGIANPIHALGRAVSRLVAYPAPGDPRTTFNVGRIEGGASINVIPREAFMDVDLRSTSERELRRLEAFFRRAMQDAADDENLTRRQGHPPLDLSVEMLGERPTGETPSHSPIVEIALEATRLLGIVPVLDQASTDSNYPISLGIPAITLGAGGSSGNSHTLDEWYDPSDRVRGLWRGLLVTLALVGLSDG